jgi:hypothetical protein
MKNTFKKSVCCLLAAVSLILTVLPAFAEETGTTAEETATIAEETATVTEETGTTAEETETDTDTTTAKETTTEALTEHIFADADENGEVNVTDARMILRFAVKLDKYDEKKIEYYDLDNNNSVDVMDARIALRIAVKLPADYVEPETEEETEEETTTVPVTTTEPTTKKPEPTTKKPEPTTKKTEPTTQPTPVKKNPTKAEYAKWMGNSVWTGHIDYTMKSLCNTIGTRYVGSNNCFTAKNWIKKQLLNYGYDSVTEQYVSVTTKGYTSYNLIVKIPTAKKNPKIITFSAHYDCSSQSVGAVDNASGVAALLELARVAKGKYMDFGVELRFAFFTGEENGYYGAYKYRSSLSQDEKNRHIVFFNIDMAAPSTADSESYLCVSTEPVTQNYPWRKAYNNAGSNAVREAHDIMGSCGEKAFYSPIAAGMHDIVPFRKEGLPAITLSWRRVSSSGKGNDYSLTSPSVIHTYKDNLNYVNYDALYKTVRLAAASMGVLTYGYVYS